MKPRYEKNEFEKNAQRAIEIAEPVSIALPVYNGDANLREALESFRVQSYQNFELIICDNVSTDKTPEISKEFEVADKRFKYSPQTEFLNARDNFIRAFRLSSPDSKYFLWACDDNVWHEEFLLKLVSYMEENQGCSACGYFFYEFDENGVKRTVRKPMPKIFKRSSWIHILFERSSAVSMYALIRREAIEKINLDLTNIDDYPDRYYLMQLRYYGYFDVVPEVLLGFRGGGISTTKDDPWVKNVIDLKFGEAELATIKAFEQFPRFQRCLFANKFAYQSLRHNIPDTAFRWWLVPAHCAAWVMNRIRPSKWSVGPAGLEKHVL